LHGLYRLDDLLPLEGVSEIGHNKEEVFFFEVGVDVCVCFLFVLVLLDEFGLEVLEEFVDLSRGERTLLFSTSLVLWQILTQLENLMAKKTGCFTLCLMLGAVI
jgi:hypothetical protein